MKNIFIKSWCIRWHKNNPYSALKRNHSNIWRVLSLACYKLPLTLSASFLGFLLSTPNPSIPISLIKTIDKNYALDHSSQSLSPFFSLSPIKPSSSPSKDLRLQKHRNNGHLKLQRSFCEAHGHGRSQTPPRNRYIFFSSLHLLP